jgi:hypothetical protein
MSKRCPPASTSVAGPKRSTAGSGEPVPNNTTVIVCARDGIDNVSSKNAHVTDDEIRNFIGHLDSWYDQKRPNVQEVSCKRQKAASCIIAAMLNSD